MTSKPVASRTRRSRPNSVAFAAARLQRHPVQGGAVQDAEVSGPACSAGSPRSRPGACTANTSSRCAPANAYSPPPNSINGTRRSDATERRNPPQPPPDRPDQPRLRRTRIRTTATTSASRYRCAPRPQRHARHAPHPPHPARPNAVEEPRDHQRSRRRRDDQGTSSPLRPPRRRVLSALDNAINNGAKLGVTDIARRARVDRGGFVTRASPQAVQPALSPNQDRHLQQSRSAYHDAHQAGLGPTVPALFRDAPPRTGSLSTFRRCILVSQYVYVNIGSLHSELCVD